MNNSNQTGTTGSQGDNLFTQWRQGRLSERRGLATVVLGLILAATLLAAQGLISSRSVPQKARQNGAQLIERISREGLIKTLGTESITRYYLFQKAEETIGYAVLVFEPQLQADDTWLLTGRELHHRPKANEMFRCHFEIIDDLSRYTYRSVRQVSLHGISAVLRHEHQVENGVLSGSYRTGRDRLVLPPTNVAQKNLVPLPLLDFFSSVGSVKTVEEDFILTVVNPLIPGSLDQALLDLRVRTGPEVPEEIAPEAPGGHTVEVEWFQERRSQIIYYDEEHQLYWQKDLVRPVEITRAVTKEKLLETFAEAEEVLQRWFTPESENEDTQIL